MDTEHTGVETGALDAYSRVVTGVATHLLPSVAALSVRTSRGAGAGSAVTFTDDVFLLTNAHVVAGATGGTVAFADGTEARFDVVGADALSDLAVVRMHNPGVPAAPLGDADKLQIGQLVVAVGNPMGLAGSVTQPPGQDPVNCGPAGTGRAGPAQPAVGSIALGLDRLPAIDPGKDSWQSAGRVGVAVHEPPGDWPPSPDLGGSDGQHQATRHDTPLKSTVTKTGIRRDTPADPAW